MWIATLTGDTTTMKTDLSPFHCHWTCIMINWVTLEVRHISYPTGIMNENRIRRKMIFFTMIVILAIFVLASYLEDVTLIRNKLSKLWNKPLLQHNVRITSGYWFASGISLPGWPSLSLRWGNISPGLLLQHFRAYRSSIWDWRCWVTCSLSVEWVCRA